MTRGEIVDKLDKITKMLREIEEDLEELSAPIPALPPNYPAIPLDYGHYCFYCGQWIAYGQTHFCRRYYPDPIRIWCGTKSGTIDDNVHYEIT